MIPDPLLFTFSLLETGALLFLLVYFVSFSNPNIMRSFYTIFLINKLLSNIFNIFQYIFFLNQTCAIDNNFIRFRMRLLECSAMLFKAKFLGHTKTRCTRIFDTGVSIYRSLLVVSLQCSDVWMVCL